MRSILSGSVLLLFWSLTINLFLQEAEHETAFSCRKSSVMVYYPIFDSKKNQTPLESLFYKGFTAVLLCFQV